MPTLHTMLAFALISVVITVIPGPSTLFVLSQGLAYGRRGALTAMLGIETASATRVLATAAGLSALLASSVVAFDALRWAGVAYLAYLGVRSLTSRSALASPEGLSLGSLPSRLAYRGLFVGLGNPKMAVFFLAFLPQFIHRADGSTTAQVLILGAIFWVIGVAWDLVIACASGSIGNWLRARPLLRAVKARVEGCTYLALAGWGAASGG